MFLIAAPADGSKAHLSILSTLARALVREQFVEKLRAAGIDKKLLAQKGTDAFLQMALIEGVFHADPHPGNMLIMPDNRIGFIDFGIIGRLSQRRREKHPDEMTIVLQHQFWDLNVSDHAFEVGLSFSGVPERLLVPFDAITGFFDPSVQFGLKFDTKEEGGGVVTVEQPPGPPRGEQTGKPPRGKASEPAEMLPLVDERPAEKPERPERSKKSDAPVEANEGGADVVSLDAFRKKH